MANKYTTRLTTTAPRTGGLISMPGIRSTNPVIQTQIEAVQKRREEEEREAAVRLAAAAAVGERKTTNTGVENAMAGLGTAPTVTPASARLKSTNPAMQAALDYKYAQEDKAYAEWEAQRRARQEAREKEVKAAGGYWESLRNNADFGALSGAREDVYDPTYRYVNDPEGYGREYDLAAEGRSNLAGLRVLNDNERRTYTYLYNKSGQQIAKGYLDEVMAGKSDALAEQSSEYQKKFAEAAPVASSLLSPIASTMGGTVSAVDLAAQGAKKLVTGEDIDYNSRAQQVGRAAEDIRETVEEDIESPVGRFLYNVGMSAADSLAAGTLGSLGGGITLGLSAGASAARDAKERGASDGQALLQGAAAGIAEAVFEKFSIGEFKALKDVPVTGVKSVITNIFKSMGVNASEEAATEIANIITDRVIMGDMSNYRTSVEKYKAADMSDGAAKWKAAGDALGQVGLAALSGVVMGGAFGAVGSVQSGIKNIKAGGEVRRAGAEQDVLDVGGAQVKGTEARALADRLTEKQAAGETLGRAEIGALARETALQEEKNRDALGNDLPLFADAAASVRASAAALRRAGQAMGRNVYFYRDNPYEGGYAKNGDIWINIEAKDPMAQVFAHELTHTGEGATETYGKLRDIAVGMMGTEKFRAAIEQKKEDHRTFAMKTGRGDAVLDDAGAEAEAVADWAAKTLFTDEAAIAELAKRNGSVALRLYDRIREWSAGARGDEEKAFLARAQRLYAQALRETRGRSGERQNRIGRTENNEPIVIVERDILEGVPESEWTRIVKENLGKKFPNGLEVNGQKIKINSQTKKEITESKNTKWLRDNDKELYANKMRATDNADEIVEAAGGWVGEEPDHDRTDNIVEFARGSVMMQLGKKDYTADVVIGTTKNGSAVLYDIVAIKREKEKNPTRTESNNRNRSLRSSSGRYAITPQSLRDEKGDRKYVSVSDNSISQSEAGHNTSAEDVTEMSQSGRRYSVAKQSFGKSAVRRDAEYLIDRWRSVEANGEVSKAMADNISVDNNRYTTTKGKLVHDLTDAEYEEAWYILDLLSDEFGYSGRSKYNAKEIALAMIDQAKKDGYLMESQDGVMALTQKGLNLAYDGNVPDDVQELRDLFDEGELEQKGRWGTDDETAQKAAEEKNIEIPIGQVDAVQDQSKPEPNTEIASPGEETPQIAEVGQDAASEAAQEEVTEADEPVQEPVQTEQEQHERKESEYWYMIDRMMERAANKDSFGDAYSGVSGDIGALLRREADSVNTPKTTEAGRAFAADGSMAEKGVTREMLNSRAIQYLEKLEFSARKTIGFALGMTYWADHAETDAAVERLVTQYLWNGQYAISEADAQRKTNEAFDALFADAVEKNRAFYEKYGNIGNAIAKYVGIERKDAKKKYREFKRRGALEGYAIDEKSIADVYKILQEQAAELFPDREGTVAKLERMLQIASRVEQVGARLERMETEAGYLNEVMRAKVDFANAINDTLREAELVRRYAEDKRTRAEEMEAVPTDPMDLVEVARKVKDLKREADRLADKYLFTDADKAVIDRLLRGELKPSEVVSPNKAGILAVYEKRAEVEAADQVIRRYNARRRERQDALADTSMGNIDLTKDKRTGIAYSTNTMERNVADVFKNKDAAKAVRENFFDNVHRASAAMVRAQNALNERVAALKISQKAAKGNRDSEAYVIQLMGEAQDSLAQYKKKVGREPEQINGRTKADWEGVIADIKMANPNMDWSKIEGAIGEFRKIYNDLFEQMNLVRVTNGYAPIDYRRGYFPHFQKNEPDTIFGKLLAGLGVQAEVTPLPTSINGLTSGFKPGIKWTSFSQERKGFATDYDVIEGFKRYTRGALHVIYQTENIQKLRALERRIRYATTDDGMKERIKAKQAELDADATKSEDEKLAEMESLWATGRFTLSKFCNELSEYTNLLAGKKSKHDRPMEDDWNRFWYNVSNAVTKRLGANMVSANIGSALTNFIPLQQGYAQLGARRLMTGMWDTVKAIAIRDDFAVQSNFLTNRRGSTEIGSTTADKISKVAGWIMETVDGLTSETLVRARYAQNIKAGLSQEAAMDEADRWAAKVMGDRSMGSMPTIFHRKNFAVKAFTQFQLEVANNVGYLFKDMPRDAAEKGKGELAKLIAKYVLSAFLFNELYEFFFGRRPGLDPFSWVNEAAGDFAGYEVPNLVELVGDLVQGEASWDDFRTEREGIYSAAANLFKNVAEQTPFVGGILPMFVDDVDGRLPISSAMPNIMNIGKAFDKDRAKQDRMEMLYKEISKPLFYLAMPMGGGQLKKAIEGIAAVVQGGSYTYNAQGEKTLQYPIYQDTAAETVRAYARAVTLGKSSFGTAQDWVDSGFDSFSAKETAIYRGLLDVGVSSREAYAAMRELGAIKKTDEQSAAELKRKALREMDMSEDAKAVIYYGMLATEKEQALLDAFKDENFSTARAAMLLNDMRDAKTTAEERRLLADARGLGDVEKVMIYREKISTAWDDEIAAMHEAGFMFDDFLEAQNKLAELDARANNKKQRDNDFIDWAIGQGYDLNKRWVMMDCFGVSTEAKKDNQKKKFGLTLPSMPRISLPEIKMPSLPQINLPGFGG